MNQARREIAQTFNAPPGNGHILLHSKDPALDRKMGNEASRFCKRAGWVEWSCFGFIFLSPIFLSKTFTPAHFQHAMDLPNSCRLL